MVGTGAAGVAVQGSSVSISADGNTAMVGGYYDNSYAGAAWVYTRSGGTWSQQGNKLVGTGAAGVAGQGLSVSISADGNTAMVGGNADNSGTGAAWAFNFVASTNANLSSLTTTAGTFDPTFAAATTAYTASVSNATTSITITPTVTDAKATLQVRVNGGGYAAVTSGSASAALSLNVGANPIDVKVTAEDGTTIKTYTITVTKAVPAPTITSYLPATAYVGSLVTITGTDLLNPTAINIGGVSAIPISNDGTTLVAMVMPGATTGTVSVTTGSGTVADATNLTIYKAKAPNTQQGNKLVGTGAVGNAQQGWSLSISADGNTAIVGGYTDDSNTGAAWVYTRSGGTWTQQGNKLVGTGAKGKAYQGSSVSISADGNTAMVGGYADNSGTGAAWVYTRSGSTWSQQGNKLVGTGAVGVAGQGLSVSISADGNTAMVGGVNDNSVTGAAWVYTRSGSTWSQQGNKLVGTGAAGVAGQGLSVSISADGNTAVVGGYYDNNNAGAAWVYTRSGSTWSQQGNKLVGTGAVGNARQGSSVSISADGNTAMVGGYLDNNYVGAAWVYTRSGGTWSQQGNKLIGTGAVGNARQGSSVSISADGNTAMVGGYLDNNYVGATWVYARSGSTWSQQGNKLVGTGVAGVSSQGYSVSISADGNTAMVGGNADISNTGAAWAFNFVASTNANLSSLTTTAGTFDPTFAAATTAYTASVSNATSSITITPTVTDATATLQVRVNGSGYAAVTSGSASAALSLNVGANPIDVKVTAEDGTTLKTYTITVTRRQTQTITFNALMAAIFGDADFSPGATASSSLTVTYASSNTDVATIVSGKIHIVGAGSAVITASQVGDDTYDAATDAQRTLTVNKAAATLTLSDLAPTYDGSGKSATVTTNPVGLNGVTITYAGSATAPTAAGTYAVVASLTNGNYSATDATGSLVIGKATATLTLSDLAPTYDGSAKSATVTTNPVGLNGITITYAGSATAPTAAGTYAVVASLTNGNYSATDATGSLVIGKATATLTLSDLTPTYDGSGKSATVTTNPVGLNGVTITYAGSATAPTAAGTYAVVASLTNGNYSATDATGNLVIRKATATLTLSDLAPTYDGSGKSATVTTNPVGLNGVTITYAGSATAPTAAGTYAVVASLTNGNYSATDATGSLVIGKANQNLTFNPLANKTVGDADFDPMATASSNLTISYTSSDISVATIVGGKIHIVADGNTTITAKQAGDASYNAATDLTQLFTVVAPLPVSFISFDAKLNNSGSVDLTWLTASEKNNSYFIVLKSIDGINFSQLAKISGNGNSDKQNRYQTADKNPANGNNYYQLVQYDFDGKATVLAIKVVNVSLSNNSEVTVYPNPVKDVVNVKFESGQFTSIKLIDMKGSVLMIKSIDNKQSQISLENLNLPAATYIIRLDGKAGSVSKTMVKN